MKYHIAAVAKMTDLTVDTIRAWERRYNIVQPERDDAGLRVYDEADVERLRLARIATQMGHPIRKVAVLAPAQLRTIVSSVHPPSNEHGAIVDRVLEALDRSDAAHAEHLLRSAALLLPVRELILHILAPVLRAVGERWERGRLSVWQEHLISTLIRNAAGSLAQGSRTREAMLFATPPFDVHEFGSAMAAMLAASAGHVTYNLGSGIPASEVNEAAGRLNVSVVVIGMTHPSSSLQQAVAYIRELDECLPPKVAIWIGGTLASQVASAVPSQRLRAVSTLEEFEQIA